MKTPFSFNKNDLQNLVDRFDPLFFEKHFIRNIILSWDLRCHINTIWPKHHELIWMPKLSPPPHPPTPPQKCISHKSTGKNKSTFIRMKNSQEGTQMVIGQLAQYMWTAQKKTRHEVEGVRHLPICQKKTHWVPFKPLHNVESGNWKDILVFSEYSNEINC